MTDRTFATVIALLLVAVTATSRVMPHPWNFTPMIAVALFAGARIARWWLAGLAVIACLALGDLLLGPFPYDGFYWVYGAFLAVAALGRLVRARTGVFAPVLAALGAGFMFFLVTNLAVFAGDMYPHTWTGLVEDFTAALPFYRNQIIGDVVFTAALFGVHAAATSWYARRAATA